MMSTLIEILPDLRAGRFLEKADAAMAATAKAVIANGDKGKKGKVVITFEMQRIGESNQVTLTHGLQFSMPTARGKAGEEDVTETPMHVSPITGALTLMPDTQARFDFAKDRDDD